MSTTGGSSETHDTPVQPPARPAVDPRVADGEDPRGVPRTRHSGGIRSMVISMAVILAMVAVVVWLLPRPNAIEQPAVDVDNAAQGAVSQLSFTPPVPTGLDGWTATSAQVNRSTDDVITWHVGYRTAAGKYLAIEVAKDATTTWLKAQTASGTEQGTQTVGADAWTKYLQTDRSRYSLVREQDGLTVVATGEGSYALMAQLVTATEAGWAAEGSTWGAGGSVGGEVSASPTASTAP